MAGNIYQRFGVETLINGAGKMTALGGTAQSAAVARAQAEAAGAHIDMQALRRRAGTLIAQYTKADAACVTTGAAAGIAISVAACITGTHMERVLQLPDATGLPRRVLLQAGHDVNFGAAVTQMIRLGGGAPHILGTMDDVPRALLEAALQKFDDIAALLFVQSHHSAQQRMIDLPACIGACHERGVAVIVDAAAEEDLQVYIAHGADLVTYSGGKAIGGPTVGFIAGRSDLIEACELQQRGIARAMKVGKEQIVGLLAALEAFVPRDVEAESLRRSGIVRTLLDGLRGIEGVRAAIRVDEAGRDIERVSLGLAAGGDLRDLLRFLAGGTPSIRTRNHHVDDGYVLIDPREIDARSAHQIVARVRDYFTQ